MLNGNEYTDDSSRTATLSRSFSSNYVLIGQDTSNYYVMERDSSNASMLYIDQVSKTDMSVTSKNTTISGATLARNTNPSASMLNGIVSNGFVYWISGSDAKTFVRINLSNSADVSVLTSYLVSDVNMYQQPFVASAGLILGRNFLINGDFVYPVALHPRRSTENFLDQTYEVMAKYKDSPMLLEMPASTNDVTYNYLSAGGCLFLPYLASCLNLQNPVVKNSQKTMRVEYLLTSIGG